MVNYSGEIVVYYGTGITEPEPTVPDTPTVTPDPEEVTPPESEDDPSGPIIVV